MHQPLKIFAIAAAQVVQHPHLGLALKMFHYMTADESGTASDKDAVQRLISTRSKGIQRVGEVYRNDRSQ